MFKSFINYIWLAFRGVPLNDRRAIAPCGLRAPIGAENRPQIEEWFSQTKAGSKYISIKVYDDPDLVPNSPDIHKKYKAEVCQKAIDNFKELSNANR